MCRGDVNVGPVAALSMERVKAPSDVCEVSASVGGREGTQHVVNKIIITLHSPTNMSNRLLHIEPLHRQHTESPATVRPHKSHGTSAFCLFFFQPEPTMLAFNM